MANEYLKRTPTSTGNRKVWTWSAWIKRNESIRESYFSAGNTTNASFGLDFDNSNLSSPWIYDYTSGFDWQIKTNQKLRDSGNFFHYLIAYNTTEDTSIYRINLYINGIKISSFSTATYPSQSYSGYVNSVVKHTIGAYMTPSFYAKAELTDVFFVDGQALTPDVFGFYKDGDGYMSSGTPDATDFRAGQWSPHSPRKIKTEIERKGGFGVNGFYLPMNDSSNPGADFHCTPNSIIKLKGEDLPQPRNGAPTTSDAFVSQLRQETGTLGFDGAVKFDGSGDNLSFNGSSIDFGTGDFTVEAFVYHTGGTDDTIISDQNGFTFTYGVSGKLRFYHANGSNVVDATPNYVSNRWVHVAVVRSSNTLTFYQDGNAVGSHSYSNDIGANSTTTYIGKYFGGTVQDFKGLISNLRVIQGTALYTSNFTPPTEPLTNVTNTKLLCCNSSTSATAATVSPGSITANGNAFATRNELTGSIVLAVPGISTATGANLVTNGTFDTNTTGWTSQDATLSVDNGRIKVLTTNTNYGSALQTVTGLTVGQRYTFQVDMYHGNASLVTAISGASPSINSGWQSADYVWKTSFTATTTSLVIDFQMASQSNVYGFWDNVILKAEDAPRDYSADIKGSGTNKTLTTSGNIGVGYELGNYYGSAMQFDGVNGVQFDTGYSIDGTFGSGDYTIECWIHSLDDQGERGIFGMLGSQYGISLRQFGSYAPGGNLTLQAHFGQSAAGYRTGTTVRIQDQWNHVAMVKEGTIGTLYLNGVAVGIANNVSSTPYSTSNLVIGIYHSGSYPFKGYIQDFRVYTTAKYKGGFDVPKPYTPVGIESWRTVADTCKNNFATLNPLQTGVSTPDPGDFSDGNLTVTYDAAANHGTSMCNIGLGTDGNWYAESRLGRKVQSAGYSVNIGVTGHGDSNNSAAISFNEVGTGYRADGGEKRVNVTGSGGGAESSYGDSYGVGDIIGIHYNAGTLTFYKNGVSQGVASSNMNNLIGTLTGDLFFGCGDLSSNAEGIFTWNFGQNPTFSGTTTAGTYTDGNGKGLFKYQPPSGALALCEDNLPTPAIADPGDYFKTVLWTGYGNSGRSITGVGFQPDLVWVKSRSTAIQHYFTDVIRGEGNSLASNDTAAETSSTTWLQSFDSNGFSIGSSGGWNGSGRTYVAWCWKAGGPAVSNNDGSITTQVSANRTAGFSIVTGTQTSGTTTFGHGLDKAPEIIITKQTNGTTGWYTYHKSIGYDRTLRLDQDSASSSFSHWVAHPTTSVFSMGSGFGSGEAYVCYCWHSVEGFSKVGLYNGNGNADGTFVYCGFKPAWVLIKNADQNGTYWTLFDSSRKSNNPANRTLNPNLDHVEESAGGNGQIDLLSNGFKCRNTDAGINGSGINYVYLAFAESPFQTANAK